MSSEPQQLGSKHSEIQGRKQDDAKNMKQVYTQADKHKQMLKIYLSK